MGAGVMGWFSKKCPHCGGELTETGYAFPFPSWRCKSCIKRNNLKEEHEDRLNALSNRINDLERQKSQSHSPISNNEQEMRWLKYLN